MLSDELTNWRLMMKRNAKITASDIDKRVSIEIRTNVSDLTKWELERYVREIVDGAHGVLNSKFYSSQISIKM
jgi:hypothetical protein